MPCRFASSGTVATSRSASRAILALNVASNFLRDLVISVLHPLRQSRTLHTLTFGPISGVHFTWRAISIMFCALGINKQLDLQTAMTELGRIVANHQGWYNERQTVQIWFIVGVAIVCVLITCVLLTLSRRAPPPTWLALVGTATVLAFVLIRAASFHHIDRFLGATILGLRWNWVLEMGGISTVIVASEVRRRRLKTRLARELQRRVN